MRLPNAGRAVTGVCAAMLVSLPPVLAIAGGPPKADPRSSQPTACRLTIQGQAIQRLTVVDEHGRTTEIKQPGSSVSLPAGKYRLQAVELQGGFRCNVRADTKDAWTQVSPDKSPVLKIGAPLKPTVHIARQGRVLTLDYKLLDAEGRNYSKRDTNGFPPPKFTVRKDGRIVGSGVFEYG